MAFALTYNSLRETVISYLQNSATSLADNLDVFIMLAQRRIAKDCKTLGMEAFVNIQALTLNQQYIEKPANWKNTLTFSINPSSNPDLVDASPYKLLVLRSFEYAQQYNEGLAKAGITKGVPTYYADAGFYYWYITPAPDAEYSGSVQYMKLPQLIDEQNQTNWITDNAPECLIFATLAETAPFLQDDPRIPVWEQKYQAAMQSLNNENAARKQDRLLNIREG